MFPLHVIVFLAPMLLVLLTGPVLGERLSLARWLAVIGGFLGVLLIVRPGGALDTLGVLFALLAAVFNSVYQLLSRLLIGERTVSLLYQSAVADTDLPAGWTDQEDIPDQFVSRCPLHSWYPPHGLGDDQCATFPGDLQKQHPER